MWRDSGNVLHTYVDIREETPGQVVQSSRSSDLVFLIVQHTPSTRDLIYSSQDISDLFFFYKVKYVI